MWDFVVFVKNSFMSLTSMLDSVVFSIPSINDYGLRISLLDIMIGFIAMGIIISVFWKGARSG